jgi:hypothetical protein
MNIAVVEEQLTSNMLHLNQLIKNIFQLNQMVLFNGTETRLENGKSFMLQNQGMDTASDHTMENIYQLNKMARLLPIETNHNNGNI